jgi:hypothetical protein
MARTVLARTVLAQTALARTLLARTVLARTVMARTVLARTVLAQTVLARTVLARTVLARMIQQNNLQNMRDQLDLDPHSLINTSVYRRFTSDGVRYATGADDGSSDDPVAHGIVKEFWLENGLHR